MVCPRCKEKIEEGTASVCPHCGQSLSHPINKQRQNLPWVIPVLTLFHFLASLLFSIWLMGTVIGAVVTDSAAQIPVWLTVLVCTLTFPAILLLMLIGHFLSDFGLYAAVILIPLNSYLWGWGAACLLRWYRRRRLARRVNGLRS